MNIMIPQLSIQERDRRYQIVRAEMVKRGIDCLMGITAADDRLPRQILTPNTDGGAAGAAPKLDVMLKEFYPARGLDADGRPTRETLQRLGLTDLSAKLHG